MDSTPSISNFGRGPECCLGTSTLEVLVVDDFELFRQLIRRMLQDNSQVRVIREASDGQAAVQQAEKWQPDLIFLDIGLPTLNGLEAATQIRKLSPNSKILFLSQESSIYMVQEAFKLGAWGYVVKSDAGTELLTAVNAILRGERFVPRKFAGNDFTGSSDTTQA